jgi:hypothetical protein
MKPTRPAFPRETARIALLNVLVWTAISAFGAFGRYNDRLQHGLGANYLAMLLKWCGEYLPMTALSFALSLAMLRRPALLERPRHVAALFLAVVLLFQPAQWLYIAWFRGDDAGGIWRTLAAMRRYGWFMAAATFAVMVAIANWRQSRARHRDTLKLQLALEQQRLLALRAQLEPHFMFNALNAISALVRGGDSALALGGINRLSELLRYALAASVRDTVSVADELQFVRDYLDLQGLRYGERLRVSIDGESHLLHEADCPPLLLQPLVENALRHDLDCHGGPSDIRLRFERSGESLLIQVSNPMNVSVSTAASPNPGAGLGLSNTRDRLRIMHPGASLQAGPADGRFVAEVRLPLPGRGN